MRELIQKKRGGGVFTAQEVGRIAGAIADGSCSDEQIGAFATVCYLQGLNRDETLWLAREMAQAGRSLPPRREGVIRLDKHSTGGVGDKVSLVLTPLLAACGAEVPMLSGRGLRPTGGTLDKLEAIPGFRSFLTLAEMARALSQVGCFISGPGPEIVPAEARLYRARELTGTVDSIPLITASILAKKFAEGLDGLVLDIKVGQGAFMQERSRGNQLASSLVQAAAGLGMKTVALVTAMEEPLGRAVGNALEVQESIEVLRGGGPADLRAVTFLLGAELLLLGGLAENMGAARRMVERAILGGKALERFQAMVENQGGDPRVAENTGLLPRAPVVVQGKASHEGFVANIQAWDVGMAVMDLGAGGAGAAPADPACGVVLHKKVGEPVGEGEPLFEVHGADPAAVDLAVGRIQEAYTLALEGVTHDRWVLSRLESRP